jgi:hypothetical protein
MAQTLSSAITKLKKLRATLADPVEFFQEQLDTPGVSAAEFDSAARADANKWIGIAQQTARDVVYYALPAGQDPYEWGLIADYIAAKVKLILGPGGHGVVMFLGDSQTEFSFASIFGPSRTAAANLTLEQVSEYVEAGLRGDPLGKEDITQHDVERTPQQTAWNILLAFQKRGFAGDREQDLVEFTRQRTLAVGEEFFPAIREAWVTIFSVVAIDDFKVWLERIATQLLR